MSLAIWPPVSPEELKTKAAETQQRELAWLAQETIDICHDLKHGLEDCYALLAPIDPGSTLVMSTPRNERVKGTITRVGTRIVKGTLHLQLRTLAPQTITLSSSQPIHIHDLDELQTHLNQSIDLLALTTSRPPPHDVPALASTLDLIADSLAASAALLKGPPMTTPDTAWQSSSCPQHHFDPPLPPNLSFHIGLQESSIVLWLRALEPAGAPVHFGTKLGLAIGTVRRLEHDEMDLVFPYRPSGDGSAESKAGSVKHSPEIRSLSSGSETKDVQDVYVREKVRVESADPSLISLYAKLSYLAHMLGQTRRNLAAVMGADMDD